MEQPKTMRTDGQTAGAPDAPYVSARRGQLGGAAPVGGPAGGPPRSGGADGPPGSGADGSGAESRSGQDVYGTNCLPYRRY